MSDCAVSGIAITIALVSLGVSAFVAFRDRGTITAAARYLESYEHISDGVYVHIVNSGRRPVTIRRLLLTTEDGKEIERRIGENGNPVRLLESEDCEFQLNAQNSEIQEWSSSVIKKAVVEDSHGKQYEVSGLVEAINQNAEHLQQAL